MDTVEYINTIRNVNIIEDTKVDYHQESRNNQLVSELGRVNVTDLTAKQAGELGFGLWDETSNLHLIPYFLYDFLEYGQELTSISGSVKTVTPEYKDIESDNYIDNDHRFGCLAYGFIPKE